MRMLALFTIVAVLHFVMSVVGVVVALPAAFDTQAGFWAAPGKALLAWIAGILLAPLAWAQPLLPRLRYSGALCEQARDRPRGEEWGCWTDCWEMRRR